MRRRLASDDGAVLVIVLVFVTVVALITLALLQFGLDQPRSTAALASSQRIANALDAGVSGAAENLRTGGACASLTIAEADGLPDPITVVVTCDPLAGGFALTARAYLAQQDCGATGSPTSAGTSLSATVVVVGSGSQARAEVESWQLGSTTRCEEVPHD